MGKDLLLQIAIQLPLGVIVLFFLARQINQIDEMLKLLNDLDKRVALQEKDVANASKMADLIASTNENVRSLKKSVDEYYRRMREIEANGN